MANFNKGNYIKEAIGSVLNQTYIDWELIIFDDGSSDGSVLEIKKFLPHDRIKPIFRDKNQGKIQALREMIDYTQGEIVAILDSDDVLDKNALFEVDKKYQEDPSCGFVYSQLMFCDQDLKKVRQGNSGPIPPGKSYLHRDCVLALRTFRKKYYFQTAGYNQDCLYAEDADLILKFEEVTKLCFLDKVLYYYRISFDSQSHSAVKRDINRSSVALAKVRAYQRRINSSLPNMNKAEIAMVIFWGYWFSQKTKRGELATLFKSKMFQIHPLFGLDPRFYFYFVKKIIIFFKNRIQSIP